MSEACKIHTKTIPKSGFTIRLETGVKVNMVELEKRGLLRLPSEGFIAERGTTDHGSRSCFLLLFVKVVGCDLGRREVVAPFMITIAK